MESQKLSVSPQPNLGVKEKVGQFYDSINRTLNSEPAGEYALFLNYGYKPSGSEQYSPIQLPKYVMSRNSVQLILEVVGDCNIEDASILDVGCGRGGNAATIVQYFPGTFVTGLDLCDRAIAFCQQNLENPRLRFLSGDAENLPFSSDLYDVVLNVESSHSYPNVFRFYREVHRVLKMGGYFLYADIFTERLYRDWLQYATELGFSIELERDITKNVLPSIQETNSRQSAVFGNDQSAGTQNFLGSPGSEVYNKLLQGEWRYTILRLKKTNSAPSEMYERVPSLHPIQEIFGMTESPKSPVPEKKELLFRASKQREALSKQRRRRGGA